MSSKDTGEPAFPLNAEQFHFHAGMSLRDYFAAKAMQGLCASGPGSHMTPDGISAEAYEIADCMLEARKQ